VKTRPKIVRFAGEGSKATTFEHLQNFPSLGEQRSSGGGATTTIRSTAGRDLDHQIRVQDEGGTHEEKDRSHPLDLSAKDNNHWIQVKCMSLNPLCA
jgi:hypothetical protein